MTKTFTLVTVGTPVNVQAVLSAGGGLTAGTTYYYRVVAVRYYQSVLPVLSIPSAEVSATADAVNKTITVSWNAVANANVYIVQRTTTSGSYPVNSKNTLGGFSTSYSELPGATSLLSIIDGGGVGSVLVFNRYNGDWESGISAIDVSSDADEVIDPYDIYAADVAGGWGVVDMVCPPNCKTVAHADFRDQVPYTVEGSLYVHDCQFQLRGMLYTTNGVPYFKATTTTLLFGNSSYNFAPYIFILGMFGVVYTTNNTTYGGLYPWKTNLECKAGSTIYNLIRRPVLTWSGHELYPYGYGGLWDEGVVNVTMVNSIVGLRSANAMPLYAGTYVNNIIEDLRFRADDLEVADAVVRFGTSGTISHTWADNTKATRPKTRNSTTDITWGSRMGALHVDGTYEAKGQTDNQPYMWCKCDNAAKIGNTLLMGNTLALKVIDKDGNGLAGVTVRILDLPGYSDIWEDSLATLSTDLNATDVSTTFTVSDGTKFSVGDVIRVEQYAEAMLVTGIVGNSVTATRGYQGTTKRATENAGNPRIFIQAASLTTDANGDIDLPEFLISRELAIARSDGDDEQPGYEDDLVAAGWITRTMRTPHTVIMSKAGYPSRTIVYTMDRKREEVEKLLPKGMKKTIDGHLLMEINAKGDLLRLSP